MMVKVVFTINGKYYIYDPNTKTWETATRADEAEESRILQGVLAGNIKQVGIA